MEQTLDSVHVLQLISSMQIISDGFTLSLSVCVGVYVWGSCPKEVHTLTPNLPMGREDTVLTCEPIT